MGHIIWVVLIGFFAGLLARIISPAPNNPQGFLLTTVLGIVGAVVANFLGTALGLFHRGQGIHFLSALVGAVIVLAIWHWFSRSNNQLL